MIGRIEGVLVEGGPEALVDVGGLALEVRVPGAAAAQLPAVGAQVRLWTHLSVREDAWTLYGFPRRAERDLFRLLITVSGVGPKIGLAMLSGASAEQIALWLHRGDEKGLASLPGLGRKTAARLVVELASRVPAGLLPDAGAQDALAGAAAGGAEQGAARAVLEAMGLPAPRAERALDAARAENAAVTDDVEGWVRSALRHLG